MNGHGTQRQGNFQKSSQLSHCRQTRVWPHTLLRDEFFLRGAYWEHLGATAKNYLKNRHRAFRSDEIKGKRSKRGFQSYHRFSSDATQWPVDTNPSWAISRKDSSIIAVGGRIPLLFWQADIYGMAFFFFFLVACEVEMGGRSGQKIRRLEKDLDVLHWTRFKEDETKKKEGK